MQHQSVCFLPGNSHRRTKYSWCRERDSRSSITAPAVASHTVRSGTRNRSLLTPRIPLDISESRQLRDKVVTKTQALFVPFRPISQCYGSVCITDATRAPRGSSQAENTERWCRSSSCTPGLARRLIATRTFLLICSSGQPRGLMPSSTRRLGLSDTPTSATHLMGVTETES